MALEAEAGKRTIRSVDGSGEKVYPHNSMNVEGLMLDAVRRGNASELKKLFASMPAVRGGVMAQDALRQAKNTLIVAATLVSRSAIYGGMDPERKP